MSVVKADTATARLAALKARLTQEAEAVVRNEAQSLLAAASDRLPPTAMAPALAIEPGDGPLQVKITAGGAPARALEFGTRASPAQPFLFSALARRMSAFKAALTARLAQILRESGRVT